MKNKGKSEELLTCSQPIDSDVRVSNGNSTGANGRNNHVKVNHTPDKENSLMRNIGVDVHFALPYNAQTKPVERDFLKVKTYLSRIITNTKNVLKVTTRIFKNDN